MNPYNVKFLLSVSVQFVKRLVMTLNVRLAKYAWGLFVRKVSSVVNNPVMINMI